MTEAAQASDAHRQLTRRDWLGFFAMVVGLFMAILDIQIVASSLGEIRAGLSATVEEIAWVQTSYLTAEVIVIPLTAWLARSLSTRTVFAISSGLFTLTSFACGFSWNLGNMIVFRSLQGLSGGTMIPLVFSAIYLIFPPDRRMGPMIMTGLVATIAPTIGPTLGGWVTQALSWQWLFFVNFVPGILVTMLVWSVVDIDRPNYALLKQIDIVGVALIALFLGPLVYVLEEGPREDWFNSSSITVFALISLVSCILMVWRELSAQHPVVDLRAFRDRNFLIGCMLSFAIGIGLYGSTYMLPVILATVRGFNSLQIGTIMIVTGSCQFISGPIAGQVAKRIDQRLMLALGLSVLATGLWLFSHTTADVDFGQLFWPQVLRGVSIMFCFLPITAIALGTLPRNEIQNASGLYNLMRNLGGAIGLAGINTFMASQFDLHRERLAEVVTMARIPVNEALSATDAIAQSAGMDQERGALAGLNLIANFVAREARVMTYNDIWLLMAGAIAAGLLLMPFVRRVAR